MSTVFHVPMLIVLLLLPGTTWRDWHASVPAAKTTATPLQNAVAGILATNGSAGIALMNARTADTDAITPLAGGRTLLAGARLRSSASELDAARRIGYAALPENLPLSLAASGIACIASDRASRMLLPSQNLAPPLGSMRGRFIVATIAPDSPSGIAGITAWQRRVAAAGPGSVLILASSNPSLDEYRRQEQLTPVLLWQPSPSTAPIGLLYSPSTHQSGLIANTDIAPTIAALAETRLLGPSFGAVCRDTPVAPSNASAVETLAALDAATSLQARNQTRVPILAGVLAVVIGVASILSATRRGKSGGRVIACGAAAFPVILLFARDWGHASACGAIAAMVACLTARSWPGSTRERRIVFLSRLLSLFCVAALLSIAVDTLLNHARLTAGSLLGYSPLEGARYYGLGNEAMGVLAGASAALCGRLAAVRQPATRSRLRLALGAGIWIASGVLLAAPGLGAKAGSVPVFGVGLLAYLLAAQRSAKPSPTAKRSSEDATRWTTVKVIPALVGATAVAVLLAILVARTGESHVSALVRQAQRFGPGVYVSVLARKAAMDAHLVLHSVWMATLTTTVIGAWLVCRGDEARRLRLIPLTAQGGAVTLACLLFNDAGVVAAALCSCFVWSGLLLSADDNSTADASPHTKNDLLISTDGQVV